MARTLVAPYRKAALISRAGDRRLGVRAAAAGGGGIQYALVGSGSRASSIEYTAKARRR